MLPIPQNQEGRPAVKFHMTQDAIHNYRTVPKKRTVPMLNVLLILHRAPKQGLIEAFPKNNDSSENPNCIIQ